MRVKCSSFEEFVANIEAELEGAVYRNIVYINRTDQPIDGTREKAVKYMVSLSLFAVVMVEPDVIDSPQYILEMNQECGIDYRDSTKELNGTSALEKVGKDVEEFCARKKFSLRPGVVDF